MDLEEVKGCLRALLSSSALSYQVNSLLNDFRESTGFNLPLFGHGSAVEFLRSLQDIVQLSGNPYNPKIALVQSKKSAHIISLVDKQKAGKTKKYSQAAYKEKRLVVPAKEACNGVIKNNFMSSNPSSRQYPRDKGVKDSLFTSLNSQDFSCSSLESQLNEIPVFPETNSYFDVPPQPPDTAPPKGALISQEPKVPFVLKTSSASLPSKSPVKKASAEHFENEKTDSCYFEDVSDSENCLSSRSRSSSDLATSASCDFVNSRMRNKLKKLIKNYPNGLWCCDLPKLFLEEYHYELDYREFGYTSLIQMLSELPDVFRCLRPGKEDWILFDASVSPSAEEKKIMDFQTRGDIFAEVRGNIQKLLAKYSGNSSTVGIELDRITELYQRTFGTPLNVQSLGFKDVKSLLDIWEGSIVNVVRIGGKLFCSSAFNKYGRLTAEEALPPITADNDIFVEIFPKDAVGPEESLPQLDLTRHIAVGHVVKVCIAEVWSPDRFFVQLNKFKNPLSQFMDEMQKFYGVHLNKYKMPDSTIRPGQVCVGLYNADPEYPDEWHRAHILKVINEKTVLIHFVDFGTVTRLKKSQLRFMHRSFQCFPMQGLAARLAGIAPPEGKDTWPLSTSRRFLELLQVPSLHAELTDIDFQKPLLNVVLSHPNHSSTSINTKLVQEKLAREDPHSLQEMAGDCQESAARPEDETNGLEDHSSSALAPPSGSFNKNVPEITDEFLDVDDLSHSTLFQFKTKNSPPTPPDPSTKDREDLKDLQVTYEFDEIPDLNKSDEEAEAEDPSPQVEPVPETQQKDSKIEVPTELPTAKDSGGKSSSPAPVPNDRPLPRTADSIPPETFLRRPRRLPPGLENVSPLPDITHFPPFLLQPQDLKKRRNLLALELLAKNHAIKEVGAHDPALALRIATEMAEAYTASHLPLNLPLCHGFYPLFPSGLVPAPPPTALGEPPGAKPDFLPQLPPLLQSPPALPQDPPPAETPQQTTDSTLNTSSQQEPPPEPPAKAKPSSEFVEEREIAGKSLHLVRLDGELYLCAEELIRQFTAFTSREVADRVLQIKKAKVEYRVISKKSDGSVLQALKSIELPGVVRREKSKKLKIYLLQVAKAKEFLEALGCQAAGFEGDVGGLQNTRKEKESELS